MPNHRLRAGVRAALVFALAALLTACQPEITSPAVATGKVGDPFTYTLTARHNPTAFAATPPLPAGLTFDAATGKLTGTPTVAGQFTIHLAATNGDGEDTLDLVLTVAPSNLPPSPPPHAVVDGKELFITDAAVLGDPRARGNGAWSFRSALGRIAGPGVNVDAYADAWFATWTANVPMPGLNDPEYQPRPDVATALRDAWPRNGFRLIAIVNRLDLSRFQDGDITKPALAIGEGRFVYEVLDAGGTALPFTIIFEYKLPVNPAADLGGEIGRWARRWHALGRPELGGPTVFSADYLAELQAITDAYSANGNLNQIRTNEFLNSPWQLREFHHAPLPAARVQPVPVALTPALRTKGTSALRDFVVAQKTQIEAGETVAFTDVLKAIVAPVPSNSAIPNFTWKDTAPAAPRASFILSFNTCNGCHAGDTGTPFQHIGMRAPTKSAFLNGAIPLTQPLPGGTETTHDEMSDRADLLAMFARDIPATRASRFTPGVMNGILKSRANRPH